MRLFVDRGNLQGLKILISASIKGRSIELNVVNPAGKFTREKILQKDYIIAHVNIFVLFDYLMQLCHISHLRTNSDPLL